MTKLALILCMAPALLAQPGRGGTDHRAPFTAPPRPADRPAVARRNSPIYYGGFGYDAQPAPAYYQPPAPTPPPVAVTNDNYRAPFAQPLMRDYSNGGYGLESPVPPPPAAPVASKQAEYWLLAFPNGNIVLAVAYWTDADTLHYITRTKEQAVNHFPLFGWR